MADVLRIVPGLSVESQRARGSGDVGVRARRRVRLQPRAHRRRPRQRQRRRLRLQPHLRRGDRPRRSGARRAIGAVGLRCDGLGGADFHAARRRRPQSRAPSAVSKEVPSTAGAAISRATGGLGRTVDYHAGVTHRRTDGAFQDILPQNDWFEQSAFDGGARRAPRSARQCHVRRCA